MKPALKPGKHIPGFLFCTQSASHQKIYSLVEELMQLYPSVAETTMKYLGEFVK
jgi:hypothetical protein